MRTIDAFITPGTAHRTGTTRRRIERSVIGLVLAAALVGPPLRAAHASPSDGTYEVTSISTAGNPTTGQHLRPQLSTDGRYVAFDTDAALDPSDTGGLDTYVRDRVNGTTERATVANDGSEPNGGMFFNSSRFTADGRHLTFTSMATNLTADPDTNGYADVFMRDLDAGTTQLVSVGPDGSAGNWHAQGGSASGDGRYVAFYSPASNWGINADYGALWLRDMVAGTTTFLLAGNSTIGNIGPPLMSADGNVITYTISGNDSKIRLYAYNRTDGTTQRVDIRADGTPGNGYHINSVALSADGTSIAFEDDDSLVVPDLTNANYSDIFVRDLTTQTTELVSVSSSGVQAANTAARDVSISGNGRFVGFTVEASFLPPPPGGWDAGTDVYVHDRVGGTTWHVGVDGYGVNGAAQVALDGNGLVASFVGSGNAASGLSPSDGERYVYTAVRTPDSQAPNVTGYANIGSSASGWFNTAPTINWFSYDPAPSWGQPAAGAPPAVIAATEGDHTYNSALVCDRAGNCATGSFEVKLDTTAPTAAITEPADGAVYDVAQPVNAAYACDDDASGSGVSSCAGPVADGSALDTSTLGAHTFAVVATDDAGNTTTVEHAYTVQAGTVSETLPGPGTVSTDPGGLGATPDVPVQTAVSIPTAGTVIIASSDVTTPPPTGYAFLGRQIDITAPLASATEPLAITFTIDPSTGADPATLVITRDGVPIAACTGPVGEAAPDPCTTPATVDTVTGDISITAYSSHASQWNLAVAVNHAPGFTKGANQTVAEDSGVRTVSGWAKNIAPGPASEAAQHVNFLVSNANPGLFAVAPAISPTGTLTYTPAPNAFGTAQLSVRIHDDAGTANGGVDTSAPQTASITIAMVPDAPTAAAISVTTPEDTAKTIVLSGTDVDGDAAGTFTIVAPPKHGKLGTLGAANCTGGVPNSCSRSLVYTPAANFSGADSFTYRANDGRLNSAAATAAITVTPVNDAPTLSPLPNVNGKRNKTVVVPFVIGDVDNPASSLTVSGSSSNTALVPNAAITFSGAGSGRAVSITPTRNTTGTTVITIRVSDGSLSTSRTFVLTVT